MRMLSVRSTFIVGLVLLLASLAPVATGFAAEPPVASASPAPPALWHDYDPHAGDFKEQIVRLETQNGVLQRDSYISAYVLGEEIRVYCRYSVKAGAKQAPGLLNVHGWMGAPAADRAYVDAGWAVMAHDYCGRTGDRPHFTKYPETLRHGNMDAKVAGPVRSKQLDGQFITDPRQTSDYLWYAIQRRVLSYLERQPEVDPSRLAATGYSYGGTLMWNLATDPRLKAVVAYFGIGYNDYYRDKQVWLYQVPYVEPPKSPGEKILLASVAPEAHVPYITAPVLFLNGSNDHHGGHERGLESFKKFPQGVPWSFAIQARGHHDTDKIGHDAKLWLDKHVLGRDVRWPEQPKSAIRLARDGVPELIVSPAEPDTVRKIEIYYALKNPVSFNRAWRDAAAVRDGENWIGKLPVLDVNDYLFAFANVTYDSTIVRSTEFNAVIPAKLGPAKATDVPSADLSGGGYSAWSNVAPIEGPGGVQGFRPTDNARGSSTDQLHDPKWKAPPKSRLTFRFYCTEPQTVIVTAGDYFHAELEIGASDQWQQTTIAAERLLNRFDKKPLRDWSEATRLHLAPKAGADLTKVLFADFRWTDLASQKPRVDADDQAATESAQKRDAMLDTLVRIIAPAVARKDTTHPIFHGCYDWHSAVHGHWAVLRVARVTGGHRESAQAIVGALHPDKLQLVANELRANPKFEMPYGRAWLLRLAIEYESWSKQNRESNVEQLRPLADETAKSLVEYYRARVPSPESREYANDAWALVQLYDYFNQCGERESRMSVERLIASHFVQADASITFAQDHASPDFFSRYGNWSYLIAKTQSTPMVDQFLRQHPLEDEALRPVDPLLRPAHHLGVNWSRAWALRALARQCGDADQRRRLEAAYARHVETGWQHHQKYAGNYDAYDHWVPQFAVYALTE